MATLVQINNTKRTGNFIYFNLSGQAAAQNPQGYIIIYGCRGYVNAFDSSLYDNFYAHENDVMKLNSDINMNNHRIRNLQKPINLNGGVRKSDLINIYVDMPVKKENAFKYLMDNNESIAEQNIRIIGLTNFQNLPQLYKKTAYAVRKIKTCGLNNYDSIISFNTLTLDNDDYLPHGLGFLSSLRGSNLLFPAHWRAGLKQ